MTRAWLCLLLMACGPRPAPPPPAEAHACQLVEAGCHDAAACQPSGLCAAAPPSSDPGCGIPPRVHEDCAADADCPPDQVCNRFSFGCDVGHRCEPRCSTCPPGSACGTDGRCAPLGCPDAWSCADYGTCVPPRPGEGLLQGGRDQHGCVGFSCQSDADCPCAHCVNQVCSPLPGRCIEPRG